MHAEKTRKHINLKHSL